MADDVLNDTRNWTQTKEAVAKFRQLLLCSKCSRLVTEPVCLGVCEHMFCRSCAGPRAGDGCVVCQSPAWVKDLQTNRHLSNITQLFCSLESLLSPSDTTEQCPSPSPVRPGDGNTPKHKKNLEIWFSPRSRTVRCRVQTPPAAEVTASAPGTSPRGPDAGGGADSRDLSVFDFVSSQDSGSGSSLPPSRDSAKRTKKRPAKGAARRKPPAAVAVAVSGPCRVTRGGHQVKMKEQRLESINRQWGIGMEGEESALAEEHQGNPKRASKRVSFFSPLGSQDPGQAGPQGHADPPSGGPEGVPQGTTAVLAHQDPAPPAASAALPEPTESPERDGAPSSDRHTPKRPRPEPCSPPEGTPKRPRTSPGPRGRERPGAAGSPALPTTPPSLGRLMFGKSPSGPRAGQAGSPGSVGSPMGRSPARTPGGSHSLQGSPAVMKRNRKGETPLHLAAIKGDVEAAIELLDQGADPNLKDHAGWTPLHEACNLGHLSLVEVLLTRGALLNTPGYENDSPLHDAVQNGHPAVARLLLLHGASPTVLNLHGKRPVDYAASPEMREVFSSAGPDGPRPADGPLADSPARLTADGAGGKRDGQMTVLASKLSRPQQKKLAKLVELLGMKHVENFSSSVSHVVVPDGAAPTTLSGLQGVLAGSWVLGYSWVEACLQAGQWLPELEYEAGEGPRRGRINKLNLVAPPLFDGCLFFLRGAFAAPPKPELLGLLLAAGGRLLSRQPKPDSDVTQTVSAAAYHAAPGSDQALCTQYVLYDPRAAAKTRNADATAAAAVCRHRGKVWTAPASWVVDCIAAFCILPVPEP